MQVLIALERTDPPEGVLSVAHDGAAPLHDAESLAFDGWLGLLSALERVLAREPEA